MHERVYVLAVATGPIAQARKLGRRSAQGRLLVEVAASPPRAGSTPNSAIFVPSAVEGRCTRCPAGAGTNAGSSGFVGDDDVRFRGAFVVATARGGPEAAFDMPGSVSLRVGGALAFGVTDELAFADNGNVSLLVGPAVAGRLSFTTGGAAK